MLGLVKVGAFLGALSFAALAATSYHQKVEVDYINTHQPPSLQQLLNSTVKIEAGGTICSGWVLKGTNKVVTAGHCFDFDPSVVNSPNVGALVTFGDGSQGMFKVEKIQTDSQDDMHDWAILSPSAMGSFKVPAGLAPCTDVSKAGDAIVIIGAGLDYWPEFNFGYISNPDFAGGGAAFGPKHLVILDAKVLPGNSGGPVIDQALGCVIGTAEEIDNHGMGGLQ